MALTNHILPDSPTNNFCTLNPLDKIGSTVSEGNLEVVGTTNHYAVRSTLGVRSGKWYFETYLKDAGSAGIGVMSSSADISDQLNAVESAWYRVSGRKFPNDSPYGSSTGDGGVIGCLFNVDTGTIEFFKNNVSMGTLGSGYDVLNTWNDNVHAAVKTFDSSENMVVNFGQDPTFAGNKTSGSADAPDANGIGAFYYQPPAGAKALCTANLPEMTPDVADDVPQDYFKTVLWTGQTTGEDMTWDGTTGTVTVGFQPDLVWGKNRDFANYNELTDSVRGATRSIYTNDPTSEGVDPEKLKSFYSNGFSIGNAPGYNKSGDKHVAWCWKAGGTPSGGFTGTEAMVDGVETTCSALASSASASITPTAMSVNTKAGFSIVKYTGTGANATVPHGLDKAPEFVVIKNLDKSAFWPVWHKGLGQDDYLRLDDSPSIAVYTGAWNSTIPNNSVVSLGVSNILNEGTVGQNQHIMYCWHSVEGYSKLGSYTGNGSPDGPFVYTGFRPAWLLIKRTDALDNWLIQDSTRTPFNWTCNMLVANNSNQENTTEAESTYGRDYLSNGFKIRASHSSHNATNGTYIYAAFAEQPFKFSNAR